MVTSHIYMQVYYVGETYTKDAKHGNTNDGRIELHHGNKLNVHVLEIHVSMFLIQEMVIH